MSGMLLKYQLMACGGLGVVLLLELGGGELGRNQLQQTLNKTVTADYQTDPLPELKLPKQAEEGFSAIVERPLFIEGRKPLPDAVQVNPDAADDTGQLDDWALIGIYNKDQKQVALFRNQKEAKKYLKLNEQQTISGWQLQRILSDRVMLQSTTGQQRTVTLLKPRSQAKPPPAPPRRPASPVVKEGQPQPAATPNNNPSENNNDDS